MRIHIKLLRHPRAVRELMRVGGWRLHETAGGLCAVHPGAADESAARRRLQELGLLPPPAVRIDFRPAVYRSGTPTTVSCPPPGFSTSRAGHPRRLPFSQPDSA